MPSSTWITITVFKRRSTLDDPKSATSTPSRNLRKFRKRRPGFEVKTGEAIIAVSFRLRKFRNLGASCAWLSAMNFSYAKFSTKSRSPQIPETMGNDTHLFRKLRKPISEHRTFPEIITGKSRRPAISERLDNLRQRQRGGAGYIR